MTNWPTDDDDDMDSPPFNMLRNEGKIRGAMEQVLGRVLTDAESAIAHETAAEIDQQNHRARFRDCILSVVVSLVAVSVAIGLGASAATA